MRNLKTLTLLAALIGVAACTEVPTGHRAVITDYGKPQPRPASEGLVWYNPWSQDVVLMSVRNLRWNGATDAYTKDVQKASIGFSVTYALMPGKVVDMYASTGEEWADKIVPAVVERSVKDIVGQTEAVAGIINNRPAVQDRVTERIRQSLKARGISLTAFELTGVRFGKAFEEAVEAKQVAVENANAAKNRTVEIEEKAKQAVIAAEADAKAMQIKTAALSGNAKLVEYEAVQKWDGKLPDQMFGNAVPFIAMNK
jgi:regulator of protease activity HflC (stomatin/prohibitin superfamily)